MNDDINELIRRKDKLIDLLNKLIEAMNREKNPNEIEKLNSIMIRIHEELEGL